jgi:hypothetical protein
MPDRPSHRRGRILTRTAAVSLLAALGSLLPAAASAAAAAQPPSAPEASAATPPPAAPGTLRVVTFNASLFRREQGALGRELAAPGVPQPSTIAAVLQEVRPDLLLINEFDYDGAPDDDHATRPPAPAALAFVRNYLEVPQGGRAPLSCPTLFSAPSNTGMPTGVDLDRDGRVVGGNDARGFGLFPGQYGMLVCSRLTLRREAVRSFRKFLWRDMPGADLPPGWYGPEALAALPLSSKNHWDLPFELPAVTQQALDRAGSADAAPRLLHFLVSHPTPPGFDGPEDRNGRRNHDEIRLWADYLSPDKGGYLVDDAGQRGPLAADASFVIAGDLNADPNDGASRREGVRGGAIRQLLQHPRVHPEVALGSLVPRSAGAAEASVRQGGANAAHRGAAAEDTADFSDGGANSPGNLRVDYVLPSADLEVCGSGVFWPTAEDPAFALVNDQAEASSDHRLAWVDIALPGAHCPPPR